MTKQEVAAAIAFTKLVSEATRSRGLLGGMNALRDHTDEFVSLHEARDILLRDFAADVAAFRAPKAAEAQALENSPDAQDYYTRKRWF